MGTLSWKKHKNIWKAADNKKPVGTVQLHNNGRYSITFLRGEEWNAVFQTESTLTLAKLNTEIYYLMHRKETK